MEVLKMIFVGSALGFAAGLVLFVPSCAVVGIASDSMSSGEHFATALFWICVVGGGIGGALIHSHIEAKEALTKKMIQDSILTKELIKVEEARKDVIRMRESTQLLRQELPTHIVEAERFLDQAENDFREAAYSPFWSSIEKATITLGKFDDGVRSIAFASEQSKKLIETFKLQMVVETSGLVSQSHQSVVTSTIDRLHEVVRLAQRNFQFASIYEQRKTNQILTAGFTTLAQALEGIGDRICNSLADLGSRIEDLSLQMESSIAAVGAQIDVAASQAKLHSDRQWEALDNIQRGRKPVGERLFDLGTEPLKRR